MPYFLNTSMTESSFAELAKDKYFVDKTKMVEVINERIRTPRKYICITRPRRFGKTINAMMLACYYSKAADFKQLFDNTDISKCESYEKHLNKHNVVYIDFSANASFSETYSKYIEYYETRLIKDIVKNYPNINVNVPINFILQQIFETTKQGFIFILDEWDFIFNNKSFSDEEKKDFLNFLKDLLKDKPYVEFAYMTGVLPIAKYSSGSSLNMFDESNFLNYSKIDEYFGFTREEVENLCKHQSKVNFDELKSWYGGYKTCSGLDMFNPLSVVCAIKDGCCKSYWAAINPIDEISYCIGENAPEVIDDIVKMVAGTSVDINLHGYSAEKFKPTNRNEILSAMTIYGFLSYYGKKLKIPNKEVRMKFEHNLTLENFSI